MRGDGHEATGHQWVAGDLGGTAHRGAGCYPAAAAAPVKETITISETVVDEFLSEACGVEVTTTATGRVTALPFLIDR